MAARKASSAGDWKEVPNDSSGRPEVGLAAGKVQGLSYRRYHCGPQHEPGSKPFTKSSGTVV